MILKLELLKLTYYLKLKLMNEFMIALESFQDAHVLFTGETISENEIENKYDCRLNTLTLKMLEKELIMIHSVALAHTIGLFNPNDL